MTAAAAPPPTVPFGHPATNRILAGLMGSAVLGGLGQLIGLTVTGLLIEDLLGSPTWIGTGNAAMQIGTALGAWQLSKLMAATGRRTPALTIGYAVGLVGGIVIGFAAKWESFPLLLVGLVLFGMANTANQQARFAAADSAPDSRRAFVVGLVVWSSTIGVIVGPKLSAPAGRALEARGFGEYGGAYIIGGIVFIGAALVCWFTLRPDPLQISRELRPVDPALPAAGPVDIAACLARPAVRVAIGSLVVGQVVMVGIMSTTSVHLRHHGHDTGAIGWVISAHVAGMFAFAPISGWLVGRVGRIPVIAAGQLIMGVSGMYAALARPESHGSMTAALFLLGLGWNANFVAGSALVTEAVTPTERPRIQGLTDTVTFVAAAFAAVGAGFGLNGVGYGPLAVAGAVIALTATVVVMAMRQSATTSLVVAPAA